MDDSPTNGMAGVAGVAGGEECDQTVPTVMASLSFVLSDVEYRLRCTQNMSSIALDTLLRDTTTPGAFLKKLDDDTRFIDELYANYIEAFVSDECCMVTTKEMCLRFAIKRLACAHERLCSVARYVAARYDGLRFTLSSKDRWVIRSALNIPRRLLYHGHPSGLEVAADLPHAVTKRAVYEHLVRLRPIGRRPRPSDCDHDRCASDGSGSVLKDPIMRYGSAVNDIWSTRVSCRRTPLYRPTWPVRS